MSSFNSFNRESVGGPTSSTAAGAVAPYTDTGVIQVFSSTQLRQYNKLPTKDSKTLPRGSCNRLCGGDPEQRQQPEQFEYVVHPHTGVLTLLQVEPFSRSSSGKVFSAVHTRPPLALEKTMHFIVEYYLRSPHTHLVYTDPFRLWPYLWDRLRGIRATWIPQLPACSASTHGYVAQREGGGGGSSLMIPSEVLDKERARRMRWLEFTVATLAVGGAYLCRTPENCKAFMLEKKNFLESTSQCFTDLIVWYRVEQRPRNAEFFSLLLLLYGLNQEAKAEDRAAFCRFETKIIDGKETLCPEPPAASVNLAQTYKELEKQPHLIGTHHVRVAVQLIHCWAERDWFGFFHQCRTATLTPLQRAMLFQSFTYARFRAVLDLVLPNYYVYTRLRLRDDIAVSRLAELLMMEEDHCVQFLGAMGLTKQLHTIQTTEGGSELHLRLCNERSEPLVSAKELEEACASKQALFYPTYPEYLGFHVWYEAFDRFPNAPFAKNSEGNYQHTAGAGDRGSLVSVQQPREDQLRSASQELDDDNDDDYYDNDQGDEEGSFGGGDDDYYNDEYDNDDEGDDCRDDNEEGEGEGEEDGGAEAAMPTTIPAQTKFTVQPPTTTTATTTTTTTTTTTAASEHHLLRLPACPINLMDILEPYCPPYNDDVAHCRLADAEEEWFVCIREHRRVSLRRALTLRGKLAAKMTREAAAGGRNAGNSVQARTEEELLDAWDQESLSTSSSVFTDGAEDDDIEEEEEEGWDHTAAEDAVHEEGDEAEELPQVASAQALVCRISTDPLYARMQEEAAREAEAAKAQRQKQNENERKIKASAAAVAEAAKVKTDMEVKKMKEMERTTQQQQRQQKPLQSEPVEEKSSKKHDEFDSGMQSPPPLQSPPLSGSKSIPFTAGITGIKVTPLPDDYSLSDSETSVIAGRKAVVESPQTTTMPLRCELTTFPGTIASNTATGSAFASTSSASWVLPVGAMAITAHEELRESSAEDVEPILSSGGGDDRSADSTDKEDNKVLPKTLTAAAARQEAAQSSSAESLWSSVSTSMQPVGEPATSQPSCALPPFERRMPISASISGSKLPATGQFGTSTSINTGRSSNSSSQDAPSVGGSTIPKVSHAASLEKDEHDEDEEQEEDSNAKQEALDEKEVRRVLTTHTAALSLAEKRKALRAQSGGLYGATSPLQRCNAHSTGTKRSRAEAYSSLSLSCTLRATFFEEAFVSVVEAYLCDVAVEFRECTRVGGGAGGAAGAPAGSLAVSAMLSTALMNADMTQATLLQWQRSLYHPATLSMTSVTRSASLREGEMAGSTSGFDVARSSRYSYNSTSSTPSRMCRTNLDELRYTDQQARALCRGFSPAMIPRFEVLVAQSTMAASTSAAAAAAGCGASLLSAPYQRVSLHENAMNGEVTFTTSASALPLSSTLSEDSSVMTRMDSTTTLARTLLAHDSHALDDVSQLTMVLAQEGERIRSGELGSTRAAGGGRDITSTQHNAPVVTYDTSLHASVVWSPTSAEEMISQAKTETLPVLDARVLQLRSNFVLVSTCTAASRPGEEQSSSNSDCEQREEEEWASHTAVDILSSMFMRKAENIIAQALANLQDRHSVIAGTAECNYVGYVSWAAVTPHASLSGVDRRQKWPLVAQLGVLSRAHTIHLCHSQQQQLGQWSARGRNDDEDVWTVHTRVAVYAASSEDVMALSVLRDGRVCVRGAHSNRDCGCSMSGCETHNEEAEEQEDAMGVSCPHVNLVVCLDPYDTAQWAAGLDALKKIAVQTAVRGSCGCGDGAQSGDAIAGVLVCLVTRDSEEMFEDPTELQAEVEAQFWEWFWEERKRQAGQHKEIGSTAVHTAGRALREQPLLRASRRGAGAALRRVEAYNPTPRAGKCTSEAPSSPSPSASTYSDEEDTSAAAADVVVAKDLHSMLSDKHRDMEREWGVPVLVVAPAPLRSLQPALQEATATLLSAYRRQVGKVIANAGR